MRYIKYLSPAFFLLLMLFSCQPQRPSSETVWPETTKESRPWTRWWWMGSAVDQENLSRMLGQYNDAGFGGVEITPIYGVQDNEEQNIDFLSPQWMEMLTVTTEKAAALDMGVDMNQGTGWPFGGPQITREHAAGRLVVQQYGLQAGEKLDEKLILRSRRQDGPVILPEAVTAYGPDGKVLHLLEHVDEEGNLQWNPADGTWEVYAAFCGKTGQMVKRAAPGGEGFSMDHFSEAAVRTYLDRFDDVFPRSTDIRCFFNDSYEVYHASWTPGLFGIFEQRRGYIFPNESLSLFFDDVEFIIGTHPTPSQVDLEVYNAKINQTFAVRQDEFNHSYVRIRYNSSSWGPGKTHAFNLSSSSDSVHA
ncbi:MAG: glycosyl hydrolase, partial [Bacteroidales bacterium]